MYLIKRILQGIATNYYLYKIAKLIVSYHNNDNNADMKTNGEVSFLNKNVKKFNTIFDVGANIGDWLMFANKLNCNAKIYAFEPFRKSFNILNNKKFLNNNVHCNLLALSNEVGKVNLFYNTNESSLNSLYRRESSNCKLVDKIEVDVDTVDNFCFKNNIQDIDFLKIDVEGNELKTILGATRMILDEKIKIIQFEYGGTYISSQTLLKDIFSFFANKNYTIYKIYSKNIKRIEKYDENLETFQYSNFLAILND